MQHEVLAMYGGYTSSFGEGRKFTPLTMEELVSLPITPRETLLTPWLPAKGAAMLYAPRGIGKTFASLSIAFAVAAGASVLGWRAPVARRVLVVDGEMPVAELQARLKGIAAGFEATIPTRDHLRFLPADHFREGLPDLATQEGREMLVDTTEGVDLVVLDNLSTLAGGRENEGDDWKPLQDLVLSLRRRGTSTLMIHHAGKNGQQRGSSRREDILDTVIALKRPDSYDPADGARFEVHFEKSRGFTGVDAASFEARLQCDATGAVRWVATEIAANSPRDISTEMFRTGATVQDVMKATGISQATAYRIRDATLKKAAA